MPLDLSWLESNQKIKKKPAKKPAKKQAKKKTAGKTSSEITSKQFMMKGLHKLTEDNILIFTSQGTETRMSNYKYRFYLSSINQIKRVVDKLKKEKKIVRDKNGRLRIHKTFNLEKYLVEKN